MTAIRSDEVLEAERLSTRQATTVAAWSMNVLRRACGPRAHMVLQQALAVSLDGQPPQADRQQSGRLASWLESWLAQGHRTTTTHGMDGRMSWSTAGVGGCGVVMRSAEPGQLIGGRVAEGCSVDKLTGPNGQRVPRPRAGSLDRMQVDNTRFCYHYRNISCGLCGSSSIRRLCHSFFFPRLHSTYQQRQHHPPPQHPSPRRSPKMLPHPSAMALSLSRAPGAPSNGFPGTSRALFSGPAIDDHRRCASLLDYATMRRVGKGISSRKSQAHLRRQTLHPSHMP